jgi:hypothetical protein
VDRLEFLEVMLGDRPPLEPEETFYQRALAGDADALVEQADQYLRDAPLSTYYDEVALKGLALAQGDWARDALDTQRLQTIRQQVETLLDDLADEDDEVPPEPVLGSPAEPEGADAGGGGGDGKAGAAPQPAAVALSPEWSVPGAVLCIAGRGRLDDLAAAMLADLLQKRGLGARSEPNALLRIANLERLESPEVRLCVLSVLEGGSSAASANYFLRRIRRRLPEAKVVLGLWQAGPGSPTLTALRGADGDLEVVTSVREAVAHCLAAAQAMDAAAAAKAADGARGAAPAPEPVAEAVQPTPAPRGAIGPEPPPLERGGPLPDPEPA